MEIIEILSVSVCLSLLLSHTHTFEKKAGVSTPLPFLLLVSALTPPPYNDGNQEINDSTAVSLTYTSSLCFPPIRLFSVLGSSLEYHIAFCQFS